MGLSLANLCKNLSHENPIPSYLTKTRSQNPIPSYLIGFFKLTSLVLVSKTLGPWPKTLYPRTFQS